MPPHLASLLIVNIADDCIEMPVLETLELPVLELPTTLVVAFVERLLVLAIID